MTPFRIWLFLLGSCAATSLAAADFRIEEVRRGPGSRIDLHFTADPASYYRILAGDTLTTINTPVAAGLAGPLGVDTPTQARFFRLQQVARTDPLDTDGDGRNDVQELIARTDPLVRDAAPLNVTQFDSSPAEGDDGVAVTRETVLRFNRPLAADTVLGPNTFFAEAAGRRVLARTEIAPDRRAATLFHLEPLPGLTQVRVTFDGDKVRDAEGKAVDADRDGEPGGIGTVRFTTLNNLPVPGTAVIGRVFASELVAGPDTGTNALNRPLAGVVVSVDGQEESLRTVTDAQGNFRLEPVPAGRFFVHVDGLTALGSQWPNGDYYPVVGKAWDAVAGRTNNLAGGTGEIYLPLIKAGTLKPVSQVQPTPITFPPDVVAANPALAGVEITVPPAALFDDNGTRGGRVGIAPVPPNRLPEPLPEGLNFPLVITVQTDGPRNFATPVPVRFPNLPDPATGTRLPAGAKTALWSFDHDKGYWEIVGPATVTPDGNFVESDPGVGILQPGWHGVQPGSSRRGGRLSRECESEGRAILGPISVADLGGGWRQFSVTRGQHPGTVQWFSPEASPQNLSGDSVILKFCRAGDHAVRAVLAPACYEESVRAVSVTIREEEVCELRPLALPAAGLTAGVKITFGPFQHTPGTVEWIAPGGTPASGTGETFTTVFCEPGTFTLTRKLRTDCGRTCDVTDSFEVVDRTVAPNTGCFLESGIPLESGTYQVGSTVGITAPPHVAGTVTWSVLDVFTGQPDGVPSQGEGDTFNVTFTRAGEKRIVMTFASDCGDVCELELVRNVAPAPPGPGASIAGPTRFDLPSPGRNGGVQVPGIDRLPLPAPATPIAGRQGTAATHDSHDPVPAAQASTGLHYFRLENLANGRVLRGQTGSDGVAFPRPLILLADTPHRLTVVTADGEFATDLEFRSAPMGGSSEFPPLVLRRTPGDTDGDGLSNLAEEVLGTNPGKPDTDGDGVNDGAEARAGTSPLGGDALTLGAQAAFPTGGHAWDLALDQDRLLVAAGPAGLAMFNVLDGRRPVLVGRASTPAPALAVAARGNTAAVALGTGGLALVDLGTAPVLNARITPLGGPVTAVAFHDSGVIAATPGPSDRGLVHWVDAASGQVIARREVERPIEDLVVSGSLVYVLTARGQEGAIEVLRVEDGSLRGVEGHTLSVLRGAGQRRLRLVVAGDRLYAVNTDGFSFFRRRSDGRLEGPPVRALSDQNGWRHFGVTSGGLLVAAADPVATGGAHDIQIHRLQAPPLPPVVEFQFPTEGNAEAVVIRDGLAYVADGDAGLLVLRFQDADRAGRPPTVTLSSSTGGNTALENQRVTITAAAVDDVGTARVEFLVDGQPVATDAFFPFEHTVVMPLREAGRESIRFQARAVDTGGNVGLSPELLITLQPDQEPPWGNQTWPADRSEIEDNAGPVQTLTLWLSEPFNPASFRPDMFRLFEPGPDGQFRTADDVPITGAIPELLADEGILRFHLPASLPQGGYRAILAEGLADRRGNLMNYDHEWRFRVVGPWVVAQSVRSFGAWAGHAVRLWFNRPMNPESLSRAVSVVFTRSGQLEDPVPFTLQLLPGGTEAVIRFNPPLDPRPDPGNFITGQQNLVIRISREATDTAGSRLKQEFSTYFIPAVLTNLASEPLTLNGLNVHDAPDSRQWRLEIAAPLKLAVSNPDRARLSFENLDGSLVATNDAENFEVQLPAAGRYVLAVTRGGDGRNFRVNLTISAVP